MFKERFIVFKNKEVPSVVPEKRIEKKKAELILEAVSLEEAEIVARANSGLDRFGKEFSMEFVAKNSVVLARAVEWMQSAGIPEQEADEILAMDPEENPYLIDFLAFIEGAIEKQYFFDKKASRGGVLVFRDKEKKAVRAPDFVPLATGWVRLKKVLGKNCEKDLVDKAFGGELPSFMELFSRLWEKGSGSKDLVEWVKWEFVQLKAGVQPKNVVVCENLNKAIEKKYDYAFIKKAYDAGLGTVKWAFDELVKGEELSEDLIEWSRYELVQFQAGQSVSVIMKDEAIFRETYSAKDDEDEDVEDQDGEGEDGEKVGISPELKADLEEMDQDLDLESFNEDGEEDVELEEEGENEHGEGSVREWTEEDEAEAREKETDEERALREEQEEQERLEHEKFMEVWKELMEKFNRIDDIKEERYGELLRNYENIVNSVDPIGMTDQEFVVFNQLTMNFFSLVANTQPNLAAINPDFQKLFLSVAVYFDDNAKKGFMSDMGLVHDWIESSEVVGVYEMIDTQADETGSYDVSAALNAYVDIYQLWIDILKMRYIGNLDMYE